MILWGVGVVESYHERFCGGGFASESWLPFAAGRHSGSLDRGVGWQVKASGLGNLTGVGGRRCGRELL